MTPNDIIGSCLQTMKALRDTIERALRDRHVICKEQGHEWEECNCRVVAVHVDAYSGVALQLERFDGSASMQLYRGNTRWVQAQHCLLVSTAPSQFEQFPPKQLPCSEFERDPRAEVAGYSRCYTCGFPQKSHSRNLDKGPLT